MESCDIALLVSLLVMKSSDIALLVSLLVMKSSDIALLVFPLLVFLLSLSCYLSSGCAMAPMVNVDL